MKDNMILGLAIGFIVGALLVHNNQKASQVIEQGKQKVIETIEKI